MGDTANSIPGLNSQCAMRLSCGFTKRQKHSAQLRMRRRMMAKCNIFRRRGKGQRRWDASIAVRGLGDALTRRLLRRLSVAQRAARAQGPHDRLAPRAAGARILHERGAPGRDAARHGRRVARLGGRGRGGARAGACGNGSADERAPAAGRSGGRGTGAAAPGGRARAAGAAQVVPQVAHEARRKDGCGRCWGD